VSGVNSNLAGGCGSGTQRHEAQPSRRLGNASGGRHGTVAAMTAPSHAHSDPAVSCTVSLVCPTDTMGGLRTMLAAASRLGADDALELLDGRHAQLVEPFPGTPPQGSPELALGATLGELRAFADRFSSLPGDTALLDGSAICVDLPVYRIELAECGDHVRIHPQNVFVTVNPACRDDA
jgi:hypothetical protein